MEVFNNNFSLYFGDIHNHCAIGYGHGSLEEAYQNAKLQLDFVCVTPHAMWHDMPQLDANPSLQFVIDYSQRGFAATNKLWLDYLRKTNEWHTPGKFITFPGYEWHSMKYGDYQLIFNYDSPEIIYAENLFALQKAITTLRLNGSDTIAVAHHIGYHQGYRGINWDVLNVAITPLVEIYSMHGGSESSQAAYPYLHTMGPRDGRSTLQYGLSKGICVGVTGSTDHHAAHPGSYGNGKLAVWAGSKTREDIWDALKSRRTYALTGDNIEMQFSLNQQPMGSLIPFVKMRHLDLAVVAGDALDYIEILHNNTVIHRECVFGSVYSEECLNFGYPVKLNFEVGWGRRSEAVEWDVKLKVDNGDLIGVEPRFRGLDVVAPTSSKIDGYAFSSIERISANQLHFRTKTFGNPNPRTPGTQGCCLEILPSKDTVLSCIINNQLVEISLQSLINGNQTGYLGGFLSPAYCFDQLALKDTYRKTISMDHESIGDQRDWYYVRVKQRNDQWAWSSPIWVESKE